MVLGHVAVLTTMAVNRNERRSSMHVVGWDSASVNGDALKSNQSLANLVVRRGIDPVALEITKEIVQGIIVALSGVEGRVLADLASVADRIVDRTVRRWLLWRIVAVVSWVVGAGIASGGARMHLGTMIIVASGISCKVLQVSNHCFPGQMWVCRGTTLVLLYIPLPPCRYPEP